MQPSLSLTEKAWGVCGRHKKGSSKLVVRMGYTGVNRGISWHSLVRLYLRIIACFDIAKHDDL